MVDHHWWYGRAVGGTVLIWVLTVATWTSANNVWQPLIWLYNNNFWSAFIDLFRNKLASSKMRRLTHWDAVRLTRYQDNKITRWQDGKMTWWADDHLNMMTLWTEPTVTSAPVYYNTFFLKLLLSLSLSSLYDCRHWYIICRVWCRPVII